MCNVQCFPFDRDGRLRHTTQADDGRGGCFDTIRLQYLVLQSNKVFALLLLLRLVSCDTHIDHTSERQTMGQQHRWELDERRALTNEDRNTCIKLGHGKCIAIIRAHPELLRCSCCSRGGSDATWVRGHC